MSQVVTLYKDKEKTDALYPRTKVSAISDDNNTSLQELLNRYEIIDNLTSGSKDKALSANQGRELKTLVDDKADNTTVDNLQTAVSGKANLSHTHTKSEITDFSHTHTKSEITDFAHTHSYNDLTNKPTIPSALSLYPVGSVYFSVNDTNPSTYFGGTWVQIGTKLAVRENVFGNGKSLALTSDGSSLNALGYGANTIFYGSKGYGNNIGTTPSWGFSSGGDRNTGVPTKAHLGTTPENSGLIVDTETIYSWKRTA